MAYYRTRTYIAADWDGDKDLVDALYNWNESDHLNFSFSDAHSLMQARDTSLPCTIKKSLAERLDVSKTFLLVVGSNTSTITKGACRYCSHYFGYCSHGYRIDNKSYIQFECEKAVRDELNIIVVYNYANVYRSICPEPVRNLGEHINGYYKDSNDHYQWNYSGIKKLLDKF